MGDVKPSGTREQILAAAASILAEEGVTARLSVRAVAARAGVSTGSLRHHFPTQQGLRDEVMGRIHDWIAAADRIHDTSLPARDRLVECLSQILASVGVGAQARAAMDALVSTFVVAEQTARSREAYLAIKRDTQHRIESWLSSLTGEDALPVAGIPRGARFLSTVLNGLAFERALPTEDSLTRQEREILYAAVDAVLTPRG
ncbi:TetR/AcrR family transcriptional regulator [Streptomyces sp. NPDC058459]|uniref:TetR/AcrR family transcriptional regulator n=1 Tax=Streptomyces sp. NPDC058459 TaxID=3346508 RepID=UPI003657A8A2